MTSAVGQSSNRSRFLTNEKLEWNLVIIKTYWLRPRETVCFVDPRLSLTVFGYPKVAHWCKGDSLISSVSRDALATNRTHEKEKFDDWYIINKYILKTKH